MSEPDHPSVLGALLAKRKESRAKRLQLEEQRRRLGGGIERLRIFETELENEMHAARIRVDRGFNCSALVKTRRSIRVFRAWTAIHLALTTNSDPAGLPNHSAHAAIRRAIPSALPSTIRSYLHRFKKQGLIDQKASYWLLTDRGKSGATPDRGGK